MVRSPSWFLKILKLPWFYPGNLSQIALSNMWLLVQINQIRRQYFSSTSTNILLIFFFSRLSCFVAFVVQSPNISKFPKQDETTKYYDRVPQPSPIKRGLERLQFLKRWLFLTFRKVGFFTAKFKVICRTKKAKFSFVALLRIWISRKIIWFWRRTFSLVD